MMSYLFRSHERQTHRELGAFSRLAGHLDSPAVRQHYLPGDGQPQPHSRAHAGHLVEALEDMGQLVLGDAMAFIGHGDTN